MKSNQPVALVTGSAKRLGAAMVRYLHDHHFRVIIHYHYSTTEAKTLSQTCNTQRAHSAVTLQADLNQAKACHRLVNQAYHTWQRLDVLINNASDYFPTPLGETTEQQWNDLINSNLKAPYFLSQAAAVYLQQVHGCIVNISDVNALRPLKNYPVYCTAKAGLNMLTQALAKELAPDVRVNAVAPGLTTYSQHKTSQDKKKRTGQTLLKRPANPEEIAHAVLFLIQNEYITGQIINVDGGKILQ